MSVYPNSAPPAGFPGPARTTASADAAPALRLCLPAQGGHALVGTGRAGQPLGALEEARQREHRIGRPLWSVEVGRAEVQYLGEIAGGRVAGRQGGQPEAPLDQLEYRRVVVDLVRHHTALRVR